MAHTLFIALSVSKLIEHIDNARQTAPLLCDVDLLPDAVEHVAQVLRPSSRHMAPSHELLEQVRCYKQRLDEAIDAYNKQQEYKHYYDYIL
jgi:hypothetical protein